MKTSRLVEEIVRQALWEWLSAHAACGYPTTLPAPEVLERPGWRVEVADAFADSFHIDVGVALRPEAWTNAIPPHQGRTETIYPTGLTVTIDRETSKEPWRTARVGFHVGQRVIVLFPVAP